MPVIQAVGLRTFGGPEVMEVIERPRPVPAAGEVVVKVAAASINPVDIGLRVGRQVDRLAEVGLQPPYVAGMELVGAVTRIGPGVDAWKEGDRVAGIVSPYRLQGGAQAEEVAVGQRSLVSLPEGVDTVDSVTIPMNGLTALAALDWLALSSEQTLGVTGAAGVVGRYVVQLAALRGIRVIAEAASRAHAELINLGATEVVHRGPEFARGMVLAAGHKVDGIVDTAVLGAACLPAIKDGGGLAAVRDHEAFWERGITRSFIKVTDYLEASDHLQVLVGLHKSGDLVPAPLILLGPDEAAEAHRRLELGGVPGRFVIRFGEGAASPTLRHPASTDV